MRTHDHSVRLADDDRNGSHTTEWDSEGENEPVFAVVSSISEVTGVDALDLPPLSEVIDPDALNDLFTSRPNTNVESVRFSYVGYEVVVHGEGTVRVRPILDE